MHVHIRRLSYEIQEFLLSLALQFMFQRRCRVEMILNGALPVSADDENVLNTARERFLDDILDGRLVHDGEHLFRCRLSRGEKSRAISCGGNHCFSYRLSRHVHCS